MKIFFWVTVSLFLVCCKTKGEDVSMWLNRHYPDITDNIFLMEQIPFFEIKEEYKDAYIEKLNDEKYVILGNGDFYLLTGQVLEKKYGLAVRGIDSHPGGEFRVYKDYKNGLHITSYAVDFRSYKKAVLIVEVDEMPGEIYNNLPNENMVRQPPKLKQRGVVNGEDVLMWLNRHYPDITDIFLMEQIPFFEIKEEYTDAYIEKLNDEKYVILGNDDFYLLTGQILEKKYGLAVRGIDSHPGGEFRVFKNFKDELHITSYYMLDFRPYKKAVLIVEVDEMPGEIYNNLPNENMVFQPPKLKQRGVTNGEDVLMWLYRHYPKITGVYTMEQIPFFEIKEEYIDAYIEKLNDKKYVILSDDDFYLLTGQILEKKYGLAVRGIASYPVGEFRVYKNNINELYITSYMVDFRYSKKAVLIVEVDEMPREIYNNLPNENMVRQPPKLKQRSVTNI